VSTSTVSASVSAYAEACSPHLRDLDPATQAQLHTDIVEIVSEVCAELEGSPEDLVGTPDRFVRELRAAAGLPRPLSTEDVTRGNGLLFTLRRLGDHRSVRWLRTLLPELRPAWWVARGVLVAWAIAAASGASGPSWILNLIPHWPLAGSSILGLALVAGAVYVSVEAGRRRPRGWPRIAAPVASLVAIAFGMSLASNASRWTGGQAAYDEVVPPAGASVYVREAGPPTFSPVVVGSYVTTERFEVVDVSEARATIDSMLSAAPPASIYFEYGGEQRQPGNRQAIDELLAELVQRGLLNP
jgi:hypothetical protein